MAQKVPILLPVGLLALAFAFRKQLTSIVTHASAPHPARMEAIPLQMRVVGVHPDNDGTIAMDIDIQNPSSRPYAVQSIIGVLEVNGQPVANAKWFGDTIVNGNSETTLPVILQPLPIIRAVRWQPGQVFSFSGKININNQVLPLSMSYRI